MKIRSDFIVAELEPGDVITEKCFIVWLGMHKPCADAVGKVWEPGFRRVYQMLSLDDESAEKVEKVRRDAVGRISDRVDRAIRKGEISTYDDVEKIVASAMDAVDS